MKESRIFYRERKSRKFTQLENVSKVLKWVNQVSINRPRSSGHLVSSKRFSGGFFIKKSEKKKIQFHTSSNNFARLCEVEKVHQHHFYLLGAFCMIVRNFRVVMRNQFSLLPFELQPKSPLVHFAHLCKFFACSCEIEKHGFSTSFCHFSHFFFLIPLQLPPNQLQINSKSRSKPIVLLLSLCIWIIIDLIHLFCH